jgi:hypothetical protein
MDVARRTWPALVLLFAACGRSALPAESGDADLGAAPVKKDAAIPVDSELHSLDALPAPDQGKPLPGDGPCLPGCVARCKFVVDCNLYPPGPAQCLADCPNWSDPINACLDGLICAGSTDCQAAQVCIEAPPLADLTIQGLTATAQGNTVTYTLKACNQGKATAGPFAVELYYDEKAPPGATQPGDQSLAVAGGLQLGDCASLTATRAKTPDGTYSSWARADHKNTVPESDETNNLGGPVSVTVTSPPMPDLIVKQLTAAVQNDDIVYDLEICNVGKAHAWLVRTELYYKRLIQPTQFLVGDVSITFLAGLGPGACKNATRTYKKPPVGIYRSWAQVDALNTVKESNEGNNVAGPELVSVTPESGCVSLCSFAISCGLFTLTEFAQCLTWCNGMNGGQRKCADDAQSAGSCADLKACKLPPKPPPPATPLSCFEICDYLINDCKLVPSGQYVTCVGGCISLPQTKVQCAVNAMNNKQCLPMMMCIL